MVSSNIPAEIRDYIVDFLFDDYETLKACSLVSKDFLHTSRTHLFTSFRVQGPLAFDKFCRLLETDPIISNAPHISYYIRDFRVDMSEGEGDLVKELMNVGSTTNSALISSLMGLPRLERLSISGMRISDTTLTPVMKELFYYVLAGLDALQLDRVSFGDVDELWQLLSACRQLKRLHLSQINWASILYPTSSYALTGSESDEEDETPVASVSTPSTLFPFRLTELGISDVFASAARGILDGLAARSWTLLRSLTLHIKGDIGRSLTMFSRVLDEVGPFLEQLTLSAHDFNSKHADTFTLSACTQLKMLCLEDPVGDNISTPLRNKSAWMTSILATLPYDVSVLQKINLKMVMYKENLVYHLPTIIDWSLLDDIVEGFRKCRKNLKFDIELLYMPKIQARANVNRRCRLKMQHTERSSSPEKAINIVKCFMPKSVDILGVTCEKYCARTI